MNKWKIALLTCVFAVVGATQNIHADSGTNRIHFINVQPGNPGSDAILLESNGHFALIDTGEDYDYPDGSDSRYPLRDDIDMSHQYVMTERLFRQLEQVGVKQLDFMLITHTHSDHIGNGDEVLDRYPVNRVYMKRYADSRITNPNALWDNQYGYDQVLAAAARHNVPVVQDISAADSQLTLGDMKIQLYNYENEYASADVLKPIVDDNSSSIISVISVNGKKIYTGGDLNNLDGPKEATYGPQIGKVDLMKFNHHIDTAHSNTKEFINMLNPSLIVLTSDWGIYNYTEGIADTQYLQWLQSRGIQVKNAASATSNATVYEIRTDGIVDVSSQYPSIPFYYDHWYQQDGEWMYQFSSGEHAIGWEKIDGKDYYFTPKGIMTHSQWKLWKSRWFYFNDSGEMAVGWKKIGDIWYYFNPNGQMETGWTWAGGNWYYMNADGIMQTGWQKINNNWYYLASSGEMKTGWTKVDDNWYYMNADGIMQTGELTVGTQHYLLANDGHMQTGWQNHSYYSPSGERATGWVKDGDDWYYFTKEGLPLKNGKTPEGYTTDSNGKWLKDVPIQKAAESTTTTSETTNIQKSTPQQQERTTVTPTTVQPTTEIVTSTSSQSS